MVRSSIFLTFVRVLTHTPAGLVWFTSFTFVSTSSVFLFNSTCFNSSVGLRCRYYIYIYPYSNRRIVKLHVLIYCLEFYQFTHRRSLLKLFYGENISCCEIYQLYPVSVLEMKTNPWTKTDSF